MYVTEYESRVNKDQKIHLVEKEYHQIKGAFSNLIDVKEFFDKEYDLSQRAEEYVYLVALNVRNRPIGIFEISHGSQIASWVNVREICSRLLMLGAVGGMIVHNHPSGDATPSEGDLEATGLLKQAFETLGLALQDHIIIGDTCYSMKANGVID